MIGQKMLLAQIDDLIAQNKFPRFSIVVGDRGMEHEDVAAYVSFSMEEADFIRLADVKVDTIRNMISQAYKLHHTTVFCIPHADDMSINAKNALLKVVEDVPNKCYFIMCLEDLSNILATIQSRAIVFRMSTPLPSDIQNFARELYVHKEDIDEEAIAYIGEICRSPGDVCMITKVGAKNLHDYATYVADNIAKVEGAEVFKFSDKLAIKDEEDKFDVQLFLRALQAYFWHKCVLNISVDDCNIRCHCSISRCIGKYMQDLKIKGINKTMLLDQMYLEMRKIWKSQT